MGSILLQVFLDMHSNLDSSCVLETWKDKCNLSKLYDKQSYNSIGDTHRELTTSCNNLIPRQINSNLQNHPPSSKSHNCFGRRSCDCHVGRERTFADLYWGSLWNYEEAMEDMLRCLDDRRLPCYQTHKMMILKNAPHNILSQYDRFHVHSLYPFCYCISHYLGTKDSPILECNLINSK